jgi:hypothetical protein
MSLEAPFSKYKKHNLLLITVILAVIAVWFWHDGKYNQKFIDKHTVNGTPDGTLEFNRKSPPFMLIAAALAMARFWMVKNKKIVVDDQGLTCEKLTIPYDRIDSIDKTYFDSKGCFIVHYRDEQQSVKTLQISDRLYDHLPAVLDHLVSKLTS